MAETVFLSNNTLAALLLDTALCVCECMCKRMQACVCSVCVCAGECVCAVVVFEEYHINYYVYILFLRYIFVDCVKPNLLTIVGEILHYRNYRYY